QLSHEQTDALRILSRQVMAQVILGNNLNQLKSALKAKEDLEKDLQNLIRDLRNAKATISALKDLVPMCSWCKKVRNDKGYWEQVEKYLINSTGVYTTGSICPECFPKYFGDAIGPQRPD